MITRTTLSRCPLCESMYRDRSTNPASWLAPEVVRIVAARYRNWQPQNGSCPNCARLTLQWVLAERSLDAPREPNPHRPLPAWECLPTPFRVGADPRFTGHGVTMAMIDSSFYPHPDLTKPRNRIRAWVDATKPKVQCRRFRSDQTPTWPGWDAGFSSQWHGLMASGVAAGNGKLSHGLYRGLASEAELILIKTFDENARITNMTLVRALNWLLRHGDDFGLRVISFSVAGDPTPPQARDAVDAACAKLAAKGITIVAAVGNSGRSMLVPPVTCPDVIVVGGLDDRDRLNPDLWRPWNSSFGKASDGTTKPDLVAPSWRVVAPMLPNTPVTAEARNLFSRRLEGDESAENRIDDQKFVTPDYQHMDGTSVASPIVSSLVACMLQAKPDLTPYRIREMLRASCRPVVSIPPEKQGAGAIQAGPAVALALAERFAFPEVAQTATPRPRKRRQSR